MAEEVTRLLLTQDDDSEMKEGMSEEEEAQLEQELRILGDESR